MRFFQLPALFAFVGLLFLGGVSQGQEVGEDFKMASVDLQRLFQEYHKTLKTEGQVVEERLAIEKADQIAKVRLKLRMDEIQRNSSLINDGTLDEGQKKDLRIATDRLAEEYATANRERLGRYQESSEKLNQEILKTMSGILTEIKRFIGEHARKADYDLVLDISGTSSNQTPLILSGRGTTDITETLIAELNSGAAAIGDGR